MDSLLCLLSVYFSATRLIDTGVLDYAGLAQHPCNVHTLQLSSPNSSVLLSRTMTHTHTKSIFLILSYKLLSSSSGIISSPVLSGSHLRISTRPQRVHRNRILRPILLALLPDARDICPARNIPQRDVLLHARRETALFGRGQRRARCGNALVEAVFVYFLNIRPLVSFVDCQGREAEGQRTHSDQLPGVANSGFLLQLLHDGGFDFVDIARRARAGSEDGHFVSFLRFSLLGIR